MVEQVIEPETIADDSNDVTEYLFKVLVVGDVGTGKTAIIKRFVHNINVMYNSKHYKATVCIHLKKPLLIQLV